MGVDETDGNYSFLKTQWLVRSSCICPIDKGVFWLYFQGPYSNPIQYNTKFSISPSIKRNVTLVQTSYHCFIGLCSVTRVYFHHYPLNLYMFSSYLYIYYKINYRWLKCYLKATFNVSQNLFLFFRLFFFQLFLVQLLFEFNKESFVKCNKGCFREIAQQTISYYDYCSNCSK